VAYRGEEQQEDLVIYHPNREKAESKGAKAIVVLLLLVSAGLTALVTAGGWSQLQGAKIIAVAFVIVFAVMAYYVARWQRGVLPLAAALAIILGVFATLAAFGSGNWSQRSGDGYADAALPADLIWLLCIVLIPVLLALIVFGMWAFSQKWNIEVEMTRDEYERKRMGRGGYNRYQTA
jgi:lysylphosphatidylglycerol synthetase-like protein (DUF2156 family)